MASSDPTRKMSNPSSTLLQDMLREKKAQTQHVNRTYDTKESDDRAVQSSPLGSMSTRDGHSSHARRGSGTGHRNVSVPRDMTMKEREQQISKLNTKIIDLRLEIFPRDQRIKALETKVQELESQVQEMDVLKANNAELQSINEDLLLELEKRDQAVLKRDQAVQDAVGLICELEGKVADLEAKIEEMRAAGMYFGQSQTLPTILASATASPEPKDSKKPLQAGRHSPELSHNPDHKPGSDASHLSAGTPSSNPADPSQRAPSVLRENNRSSRVLRSLYSSDSLYSGDDEEDDEDGHVITSPRLSILSESGFSEIYGNGKNSDRMSPRHSEDSNIAESPRQASPSHDSQRGTRLQKWIEERKSAATPSHTTPKATVNDRFSSIGEVLEKVPSIPKEQQPTEQNPYDSKDRQGRNLERLERKVAREHQRRPSSPAFGGPMFGGAILPPTPGTMSTATIADNSSTPSIVTEKSLLDGTPYPTGGYSNLVSAGRPGSSDSEFASYPRNALTFDEETDDEPESPPRNRSPKATRVFQVDIPTRPSLTTSNTAVVFSGEGYAATQPSRTLSYPSPTGRARRPSGQLSPCSEKSSVTVGDRTSSLAHDRKNGSSANTTPTKRDARETAARSPPPAQASPNPLATQSPSQPEADIKLGRSASLRSKITKMSLSPTHSTHQSVASRLFRRSNSQSIQAPQTAQPTIATSRPPITRANSTAQHARLPRPSSLYGSSPIYGQRPPPTNPVRRRAPQPSASPNPNRAYSLSPILPDGMLTGDRYSSSSRRGRERR